MDLNEGLLAACVLDSSGNPVGEPFGVDVITSGLAASRRDGRMRAAITALLDHAQQHNCSAVVVENLDFATRALPGARPSAVANGESVCAAPWPVSPPAGFGIGWLRWRRGAASR